MKSNNQINIPEAREAMDKFKMQAASEVGVNLKQGYNGDLTSREAGSVGGHMVKKIIEAYESGMQYKSPRGSFEAVTAALSDKIAYAKAGNRESSFAFPVSCILGSAVV